MNRVGAGRVLTDHRHARCRRVRIADPMELYSRVLKGHRQNKFFRRLEIVDSQPAQLVVEVAFPFSANQLLDILHGNGTDR